MQDMMTLSVIYALGQFPMSVTRCAYCQNCKLFGTFGGL